VAWSEGRRPLGAALHSPDEPSELSQLPGHDDSTINIVVVIIIIIIIIIIIVMQPGYHILPVAQDCTGRRAGRPGLDLATCWSQIQQPNHSDIETKICVSNLSRFFQHNSPQAVFAAVWLQYLLGQRRDRGLYLGSVVCLYNGRTQWVYLCPL